MRTLLVSALLVLGGCGGGDGDELTVFAAASLSDVAPAVDDSANVVLGGSNDLAAQIRDGARADVFLSASGAAVAQLREARLVEAPYVFASNRLVLVVPAANPGAIERLGDVRREGVKLVLGAPGVPAGDYAREALAAAGFDDVDVASLEDDVKGVLGKVALGEADAGIVYATDARAAGDEVRALPIANELQPDIRYYAAVARPASPEGRAYLDRLVGREGEEALRGAGFLPVRP